MDYSISPAALDIKGEDWSVVSGILARLVPTYDIWAFGSRVTGKAKQYSDLDLVVISDKPLSFADYATLKEAFDESDLPYRVDIVDWAAATSSFREIIQKNKVIIQSKTL